MAVQYIREKKKQKYFLIIFGLIFMVTIVVLWFGFFKDKFSFQTQAPASSPIVMRSKIEIDFGFLESQVFKDMEVFNEISSFEGKIGKENPFSKASRAIEVAPETAPVVPAK